MPQYEIQLARHLTRYNGMSAVVVKVDWFISVMICCWGTITQTSFNGHGRTPARRNGFLDRGGASGIQILGFTVESSETP